MTLRHGWFWNRHRQGSIKPLNDLVRIYEQSVGRNAVLELNIAPDTTGRIPEADVKRLEEFGDALKFLFKTNLVTRPGVTAGSFENVPDGAQRQEIHLPNPTKLRYGVLNEDITKAKGSSALK